MTDEAAALLRCPLDPKRDSPLVREQTELVCTCGVRFPVKNGLPILIVREADLPEGCSQVEMLPCRKKKK